MPGQLSRLNTSRTTNTPRPRLKPRGLPPALEPYGIWATSNPADASLFGRDLWGTHRVHIDSADANGFTATLHAVLIRDIALEYLDYSVSVNIEVLSFSDHYLVVVPAPGSSRISQGGNRVDTSPVMAAVPSPGQPLSIEADTETAHLIVRIPRTVFEQHLARVLGHGLEDPLVFDLAFDLSTPSASRWNFAVQMLHAELFEPNSLLHKGLGHGQLEEFVMSALLYSQPSNYSAALLPQAKSMPRSVRLAQEFIAQNLAERIGVNDVAKAVGISPRTLQGLFRSELRQSPTHFIRDQRLDRARAELADSSDISGITITQVANRWGFSHLGRFSRSYKSRFGELPSETLRS